MDLFNLAQSQFYALIQAALIQQQGFAAGKMGYSEQAILRYPLIRANFLKHQIAAYEIFLRHHCEFQTGVYPTDTDFLAQFARFYADCYYQLDALGLFGNPQEQELLNNYKWTCQTLNYLAMEPRRHIPHVNENCYLNLFEGKKILILAPFAQFLQSRGTQEIYEKAWERIGKKWFYPLSIEAIEFPYSYKTARPEQSKYKTSLELLASICEQIDQLDFDVALIGAGALGVPLAVHVKSLGKVGLSLGGHLQVIFGVAGARWRNDPHWVARYLNEHWVDLPPCYYPPLKEQLTDVGAYW